jgi:hypothetical protein
LKNNVNLRRFWYSVSSCFVNFQFLSFQFSAILAFQFMLVNKTLPSKQTGGRRYSTLFTLLSSLKWCILGHKNSDHRPFATPTICYLSSRWTVVRIFVVFCNSQRSSTVSVWLTTSGGCCQMVVRYWSNQNFCALR